MVSCEDWSTPGVMMMEYHHVSPNHLTGLPLYVKIAVNEPIPTALSTDVKNKVVNVDIAELPRSDNFFLLIKDHQNILKGEPTIDAAAEIQIVLVSPCLHVSSNNISPYTYREFHSEQGYIYERKED